jgi:pimeloyl-[acyl-carrier protein] methyl ester esterase
MLVLLPGMDGTGELFAPFLNSLAGICSVQVIRYPRDADLTYAELQQYVMNQLPVSEPITLIAESFSGPIALRLSNTPTLNIRAVVLVCSFGPRPLGIFGSMLAYLPIDFLFRIKPPKLVVRTFLLGSAASDEVVAATIGAIASVQPKVLAGRLRAALMLRSSGQAAPSTRIVAIFSKGDRLIGRTARRSLEEACPVLEEHWVEAPHFALQTSPDKIVAILHKIGILGAK